VTRLGFSKSGSFNKLENLLNSHKASLEAGSGTAKLWIRYAQYVQNFLIRAERCGDKSSLRKYLMNA
jgi:hypothetical protein